MKKPDGISVLIPIHKMDQYYIDAICSINNQTLPPNEIIVIANGPLAEEIKANTLALSINNLIVLTTDIAQTAFALNLGLSFSNYEFIARMDRDDIAHPNRLELQYRYLTENHLDLVGSSVNLIDAKGKQFKQCKALNQKQIKKKLPFGSPFCHPSIMFRRSIVISVGGYNSGFNSEDYDLFIRLNKKSVKWDNLPETLLDYRIHVGQSHGTLLAYSECVGLAMREWMLKMNLTNSCALFSHLIKGLIKKITLKQT